MRIPTAICCSVAFRSVPLRWRTQPPCRQERHGPGRSSVLAPPGSAGVSPACCSVACRSVSLRWRSRVGCPSPVAPLPPRGSGRPLPFSMPIDTYGRRWSLKQVLRSSCLWEFILGSSSFQYDDHQLLLLSKGPPGRGWRGWSHLQFPRQQSKVPFRMGAECAQATARPSLQQ